MLSDTKEESLVTNSEMDCGDLLMSGTIPVLSSELDAISKKKEEQMTEGIVTKVRHI